MAAVLMSVYAQPDRLEAYRRIGEGIIQATEDPRVRIQRAEGDHQSDEDADEPFHAAHCRPRYPQLLHQCVTSCAGTKGATAFGQ